MVSRTHQHDDIELIVDIFYPCLGVIPPGFDTSCPNVQIPSHADYGYTNVQVRLSINTILVECPLYDDQRESILDKADH